jgi:DNA-binding transcriptional LysR family regulator
VTFQVRQLEEYFNTRLFDRTHNRIALTDAGKLVFQYADRILEHYRAMDNAVRELTGDISGILIIGASTTIAEYMLPALLGDFKSKYPDINIRLKVSNTEGVVNMVESNAIDIGVVEGPVSNKNLVVEVCRMDQLVVVTPPSHPLAGLSAIPVEQLAGYPYICREEGSGTREVIFEYLAAAGLSANDLNIVMELGSPEAIKGAIEAGMGVSVLSRATVGKELQLGSLSALQLDPPLERPFSFVYQKQKFRVRAVDELLSFARSYCKARGGAGEAV